eukprot:14367141-Alexandrium_andersonii.AAC.1
MRAFFGGAPEAGGEQSTESLPEPLPPAASADGGVASSEAADPQAATQDDALAQWEALQQALLRGDKHAAWLAELAQRETGAAASDAKKALAL